jgi:hypothetical protein
MNPLFRSVALVFSALFLQAVLCFGASPAGNLTPRERGKIFFDGIAESDDVPWLERVAGSLAEAEKVIPQNTLGVSVMGMRIAAFARLGDLHTKESLSALERIEKKAKERDLLPEVVVLGHWTHPAINVADSEIYPLATVKAPDGMTYGVIQASYLMGGRDLFLISRKTPDDKSSWSRPKLILGKAPSNLPVTTLAFKSDGVLELSLPRKIITDPEEPKLEIPIRQVLGDQDADGWTDIEEMRLGLGPRNQDTDGDGLADGKDPCPNFAPPHGEENNEEAKILQKAFFAAFAFTNSRDLLLVGPKSTKAQVWGYAGPVVYLDDVERWRKENGGDGIHVNWTLIRSGNDEAKVQISMPMSSQELSLKRISGEWIVVKHTTQLLGAM